MYTYIIRHVKCSMRVVVYLYNAAVISELLYSCSKRCVHVVTSTRTYKSYYYMHIQTINVCVNIVASRVKAFVDRINVVATFGNVFARRRRMQISVCM